MPQDIKIALTYSYDGSKFYGSQTQPNLKAVEDTLNFALSRVGIFERVISSSRTDKGVHALNQVSTTHCGEFWDLENLRHFINRHAKPYIFIKKISPVSENFQVRFDAKARSYRYILNHGEFSPFLADFFYFYPKISADKLNEILQIFTGLHDFSEFMKVGSDTGSVREIYNAKAYAYKNFTIIKFKANGFLRSQVRLMVANALKSLKTGQNLRAKILSAKNSEISTSEISQIKAITRIPAPPNGLYLERIFY